MLSRKHHNALYVSGSIVIAFGVWDVIRNIAFMFLSGSGAAYYGEDIGETTRLMMIILTLIVIAIDFLLRIYVGRCALAEGRGGRKSGRYLVLAILMAFTSIISIAFLCFTFPQLDSKATIAISMVVEATSLANMLELIYSGFKVRKIHKEEA